MRACISDARRQWTLTPTIRRVHRLSVDDARVLHVVTDPVALGVVQRSLRAVHLVRASGQAAHDSLLARADAIRRHARAGQVERLSDEEVLVILHGARFGNATIVIEHVVVTLLDDSTILLHNVLVVAGTRCQLNETSGALHVHAEADAVEACRLQCLVSLIIAQRSWRNQRLLLLGVPQHKLLGTRLTVAWESALGALNVRIIAGRIRLFRCKVEHLDTLLDVTSAPIRIVTVSEEAGALQVDGLDASVTLDLVVVRSRRHLSELAHEQGSTLDDLLFGRIRIHGIVHLLS